MVPSTSEPTSIPFEDCLQARNAGQALRACNRVLSIRVIRFLGLMPGRQLYIRDAGEVSFRKQQRFLV